MKKIVRALIVLALLLFPELVPVSLARSQTKTVTIQATTLVAPTLPFYIDITPQVSGLAFDIWMNKGACTQTSFAVTTGPNIVRLKYFMPADQTYTQEMDSYGTYCFKVDAWTTDGNYTFLPALVYTTVNLVKGPGASAAK